MIRASAAGHQEQILSLSPEKKQFFQTDQLNKLLKDGIFKVYSFNMRI